MTGATLAYSPGYQLPLWLGRGQLRLWRKLDALIGGATFQRTTVRELARSLGVNPGSVSRDLDALQRLGFATHDATWGRAGVRLWRVVSRGGRRGLDVRRRVRALARMGVREPAPGQLALSVEGPAPGGHEPDPTGVVGSPPPATPVNHTSSEDREGDMGADSGRELDGPFGTLRCPCGRLRLVRAGVAPGPCSHRPDPGRPSPMGETSEPAVTPTPATAVACLDYQAHRFRHAYQGGRWICGECS